MNQDNVALAGSENGFARMETKQGPIGKWCRLIGKPDGWNSSGRQVLV
jgi:hypothetical protein